LAVVLSMAVLFAWQYFLDPPKPPVPAPVEETDAAPREPGGEPSPMPPAEAVGPTTWERAEAAEEVVLAAGEVRAVFSSRGAQLTAFELQGQQEDREGKQGLSGLFSRGGSGSSAEGPEVLDLVRRRKEGPYPFGLMTGANEPHPLDEALFVVARLADEGAGPGVEFRYSGPEGSARKRFRLGPTGLMEVELSVRGEEGWGFRLGPGLRNPSSENLSSRLAHRSALFRLGADVERLAAADQTADQRIPGADLRWLALDDTYFLAALLMEGGPASAIDEVVVRPWMVDVEEGKGIVGMRPLPPVDTLSRAERKQPRDLSLVVRPRAEEFHAVAYWGAKQYERLAELPGGLEKAVDLGTFRVVAVPLLLGLHYIYEKWVGNYGWAIVILTVFIKLLLLPITHKSYVSMRKMQELQPKLKALQAKYRPKLRDKRGRPNAEVQRKMNEEMMALYREEGVNPASGCVPLILQLPVFFAFYKLLFFAVELRNAPWLGWVQDLSAPDPFLVLPLVMAGTQFLQQRMSPPAGDAMMQKVMQFLPVILLFAFVGMPAGLVLYWLTNNVLTIAQQWIYNHLKSRAAQGAGKGGNEKDAARRAEAR
jgi:YidC/Oxa1 family membrane protein insertase